MDSTAEANLIERCRRGDGEAWERLFTEHYPAAARFVFQLSGDFTREDAEEICQESFLAVVRNLADFQGNCRFQTWLFRICANKARDYRERQTAQKRGGGAAVISLNAENPETGLAPDAPSHAPGPDAALLAQERAGLLREALEQMDLACREVIELRYFGDLSYEEIASALQLNPKTVSSRLSKCLDRLEAAVISQAKREKSAPFAV